MSWRIVVIKNPAKLDFKMNYMVVRNIDRTMRIFIDEIYMLIIESNRVSITSVLLNELSKSKVKIIFCDEKRNPSSELVSYYGSHDTSMKYRDQIDWNIWIKQEVWTEIVKAKIKNQALLLEGRGLDQHKLLQEYHKQVEFNDDSNREGHAAKVYFNALFGKGFSRSDEDNINKALNYGYSILLASVNREIVAMGYMTQIGIFHNNMFNQFNLSCDLMEPFRPFVDKKIIAMDLVDFLSDQKLEIVDYFNTTIRYDGKDMVFNNALRQYCRTVLEALNDRDVSLIRFWEYEL